MAILFSETWTAAGGDNAWSQTADADCTIDEDAASSLAGSPPGWGAKCLKCDVVGGETVRSARLSLDPAALADEADTWLKFEFVLTAHTFVSGTYATVAYVKDIADTVLFYVSILGTATGFRLHASAYLDGSTGSNYYSGELALNTRYCVEVKWDTTNHVFEWKLNGVVMDTATLTAGHGVGLDDFSYMGLVGVPATKDITAYFDNVQVSDTGYIGYIGYALETDSTISTRNRKLWLHFDGVNGSTSVIDSSPVTKTITSAGAFVLDTSQKRFGVSSGYFTTVADVLTVTDHIDFAFGTSWTVEFWAKWSSTVNASFWRQLDGANYIACTKTNGFIRNFFSNGGGALDVAGTIPTGTADGLWHHFAYTYDGTTLRLFVDGVLDNSAVNDYTMYNLAADPTINFGGTMRGWIDELTLWNICKYPSSVEDEIESFGGRNIAFKPNTNCISGAYSFSNFSNSSDQIFIGGMPLSLSENSLGYAINVIVGSSIQNYSDREILAVWEGSLVSILQREERRYLNIYLDYDMEELTDAIIFNGMPLVRNVKNRLIFVYSGYLLSDIEEFAEASIGGIPVAVGRVGNNWYLIVNNPS